MAANQQVKRKVGAMKRKTLQKKQPQAKHKLKKLQPQKHKKPLSRLEHGIKQSPTAKEARRRLIRICSPRLFISKMLRPVLKSYIETKTMGLVKTLLTDVYNHVATEVETISKKNQPSTISCTDVQAALKDAMAKELAKHTAEPISSQCA